MSLLCSSSRHPLHAHFAFGGLPKEGSPDRVFKKRNKQRRKGFILVIIRFRALGFPSCKRPCPPRCSPCFLSKWAGQANRSHRISHPLDSLNCSLMSCHAYKVNINHRQHKAGGRNGSNTTENYSACHWL